MVDGGEQARAFAQNGRLGEFQPTHVSHKHVEAYPIAAAEFEADGSGKVALAGGIVVFVPSGFAKRSVPAEGDMLVRYEPTKTDPNGYFSHSPRAVFEGGYSALRPTEHHKSYEGGGRGLSFGQAIEQMKAGDRVARDGWNGKGMWLALTPGSEIPVTNARSGACLAQAMAEHVETITILPHIDMRAADGSIVCGWLASQTDMLAQDWCVVSSKTATVGQQDTRSRGEPRVPRHDAPAAA